MKILKLLVQGLQSVDFSPIGRNIEFAHTHHLGDRETGSNFQSCSASSSTNYYRRQYDIWYYQPQPPDYYNQRQQYLRHITTQQASYRTSYNKEKLNKRAVNQSEIPSSYIKQLPIIKLSNVHIYRS